MQNRCDRMCRLWKLNCLSCVMPVILMAGCGFEPLANNKPKPMGFLESAFASDPDLILRVNQTVILALESAGGHDGDTGMEDGVDEIPIWIDSTQTVVLDIDEETSEPHHLTICNADGSELIRTEHGGDSGQMMLEAGRYLLQLHHPDRGQEGVRGQILYLRAMGVDEPEPKASTRLSSKNLKTIYTTSGVCRGCDFTGADLRGLNFVTMASQYAGCEVFKMPDSNFTDANLTGAALNGGVFDGAIFRRANLSNASLVGASFIGADFMGADLVGIVNRGRTCFLDTIAGLGEGLLFWQLGPSTTGMTMTNADFRNAILGGGDFSNSKLDGADLSGQTFADITLAGASLTNVDLENADLRFADFSGLDLSGADLTAAQLFKTNFAGANLTDVDFTRVDLSGFDLSGLDMAGAIFENTNVTGVVFNGTNLTGVDMRTTDWSVANLNGANLSNSIVDGID